MFIRNFLLILFFCSVVVFSFVFCFFTITQAAGTVSFTADTIISLSGISDGSLYVASSSQATSVSVSGATLTVSAIPDGDIFILKTTDHNNGLKLTPSGGTVNLDFDGSHLSAGEITEWTLTATGSVSVAQVVGVPSASTWYAINVDGNLYNRYQSNSSSEVSFTYSGGWSEKVFTIEETTAPVDGDDDVIELEDEEEDDDDDPDNLDISKASYTAYSDKILIQWKTNRDANSHVEYGTSDVLEKEKYNSRKVENHRVILDGLNPDTLYYFRMKSTDEYGNDDRTKIYSTRTKSAINWGLNASGFFSDLNKGSDSGKSVTEKIGELPEKIEEKLENLNFFNAEIFKREDNKYISEIKLRIINKENSPITNLEIKLFSDPKASITDENGIASFKEVELGRHTVTFNYQGENFRKKLALGKDSYEEGLVQVPVFEIKAEKDKRPWWEWLVLAVLILTAVTAIVKKSKKGIVPR